MDVLMNYYYISIWTPVGFKGLYYRGEQHPLHPEAYKVRRENLARQLSLGTGQVITAEEVIYISVCELPESVARAQFPKDFEWAFNTCATAA
jgi:hypothetical protein